MCERERYIYIYIEGEKGKVGECVGRKGCACALLSLTVSEYIEEARVRERLV